jgi:CRP-like cAMP-binding protein
MSTPTPTQSDLLSNDLLGKLTEADRQRLAPHMQVRDLQTDYVLQAAGQEVFDTWFPCGSALASFCVGHATGAAVEVALVGREGAIGGIVSNGHTPSFSEAQVRSSGRFLRIKVSALESAKSESISLRHWFSRYSDCLLAQVFQTSACNATHSVTQRTAKWLLAASARTQSTQFALTQEQLANLLGVGRTFVTRIVGKFRADGLVSTRRGAFKVENEAALRAMSCRCTAAIENHFDVVLRGIYPTD